jgi:aminomuconate-semialdehyde/2-hydroxymuconate-6-semialdehyde dehydrogenase
VDPEAVVPETIRAAFSNQGQICLSGSRILVEESLYPTYVERFVEETGALTVGDPADPGTDLGSLVSASHRDKVLSYIELARGEGGRVRTGGGAPEDLPERLRGGFFVRPTVITDVDPGGRVMQEEIFGPVVTITPFRDEAEAIRIANSTPYGLAASIWTRDLTRAHRVSEAVQSGIIWVNCWMLRDLRTPFGGMKQSGVGREGGEEALRFFTEPKNVCIRLESDPQKGRP